MLVDHTSSRDVKCYEGNGGRKIKKFVQDFREETNLNSEHLYNRRIHEKNNLITQSNSTY